MKRLVGRQFDIAAGLTDLPTEMAHKYRAHWKSQGYELPTWIGPAVGLGDVVAYITHRVPWLKNLQCAPCRSRHRRFNRWFRIPWPF